MADTWNKIKEKEEAQDPYIQDTANRYDDLIKIRNFKETEGGKLYRKILVEDAVNAIVRAFTGDTKDPNEILGNFAYAYAKIRTLQDFDEIENTTESMYEILRELLEK